MQNIAVLPHKAVWLSSDELCSVNHKNNSRDLRSSGCAHYSSVRFGRQSLCSIKVESKKRSEQTFSELTVCSPALTITTVTVTLTPELEVCHPQPM